MARRQETLSAQPAFSWRMWRIAGVTVFTAATAVGLAASLVKVEEFVIEDRRFALPPPREAGAPSPGLRLEGVKQTPVVDIAAVFRQDYGRSLYLCPIAERRRLLLAIDWVREASVSRIWPNRLVVRIEERTPVAFVRLQDGAAPRAALIDADGVLLRLPARFSARLPVLTGIQSTQSEAERRERVQLFLRASRDLGPAMDAISEVDVADPANLKLLRQQDGRLITLLVGAEDFRRRLERFARGYAAIQARHPQASVFDLRVPGEIIVSEYAGAVR